MEVEGLYDQDGEGKWYPGKVVGDKKEDGNWEVHFEDGDIFPYKALLTSAYRAARREGRMADLDPVLHPEQFDDAASGAGTPGPAAASRRGR